MEEKRRTRDLFNAVFESLHQQQFVVPKSVVNKVISEAQRIIREDLKSKSVRFSKGDKRSIFFDENTYLNHIVNLKAVENSRWKHKN